MHLIKNDIVITFTLKASSDWPDDPDGLAIVLTGPGGSSTFMPNFQLPPATAAIPGLQKNGMVYTPPTDSQDGRLVWTFQHYRPGMYKFQLVDPKNSNTDSHRYHIIHEWMIYLVEHDGISTQTIEY